MWKWAVGAAALAAGTAAQAAPACSKAPKLQIAMPEGTRITGATAMPATPPGTLKLNPMGPPLAAGLPAYCRVSGTIGARKGADGKDYAIGFEVNLPADWNGRLLYQGGGGLNGVLRTAIGYQATGDVPALARGFAVVSTDGGHKSDVGFDRGFQTDQRAALDFAQGTVPVAALVAKQIVRAHYGKAAHHSYFVGCSTGGREAMQASQRTPELFDGIVAGAPAMRTGHATIGFNYITTMLNAHAGKGADGKPLPLLSEPDKQLILKSMLDDCDGLDGLKDGVIAKAGQCRFRPARIACSGPKQATCLSAPQVKALEAAFQPPRDKAGRVIYPAFPWDTGVIVSSGGIPGILTSGVPTPLGPPVTTTEIDLDARAAEVRADAVQVLTDADTWTNLSTYLDRGGKMLWYHGVSDPWFSAADTADYYARAGRTNGPRFAEATRLYMVPGAGHCSGGANTYDTFDLLDPLVAWVEQGRAPASVPARRRQGGERPLCPWPSYPHYRGGDEALVQSFECRAGPATMGD